MENLEEKINELLPEDKLLQCMHCGFCLPYCPTYRRYQIETASPRGRLALMRAVAENELGFTKNFSRHMDLCLLCRACEENCPAGVDYGLLMELTREEVRKRRRPSVIRSFILNYLLKNQRRLENFLKPVRLYQKSGLQKLVRETKILKLLPPLEKRERLLFPLPDKPLRQTLKEVEKPENKPLYRVGFFLGCIMNTMFAHTSRNTMNVLKKLGCEVITPLNVKCCGAPHAAEGYRKTMKELARFNIDLFIEKGCDFIVTDCAGCGTTLKEYKHLLKDDPEYEEKAETFSSKIRDINEFLWNELELRKVNKTLEMKVTYHDACYLLHTQKISEEPRNLLKIIPGIQYVELKDADMCCGSAGSYCITHPDDSAKYLEWKMENIRNTGADYVAIANPGCLIQILYGIRKEQLKIKAVHPVDLIAQAIETDK